GSFLRCIMICRIVKHSRAQAILPLLAYQYLVVDTAFTTLPECLILSEFGISDRLVAQLAIDLHNGQSGRQSENLRIGILLLTKFEDGLFDQSGHPALSVLRSNDQTGVGHIFAMTPTFDI